MNEFNDWWNKIIDGANMDNKTNKNKSNNKPIQFTELTPNDITTHEDLYISLLVNNGSATLDKKYFDVYREYAIDEALKSKSLFQKTFG